MKRAAIRKRCVTMRKNPQESEAKNIFNEILSSFKSEKHYSWDVFDYHSSDYSVSDLVKALRKEEDIGGDDIMMYVADTAADMAEYWLKENAQEEFERLEELNSDMAYELRDEIRFKYEEMANYNYPLPSPIFVIDPKSLRGRAEAKKKKQNYYAMDYYLDGPYYSGEEAEKELKIVKALGKKFGFTDKECESVYYNSQGGTLGIAVITDEVKELYEAVLGHRPVELTGDCVLFIRNGANGSGDYHIKGQHTIRVKDARELVSMIDNEENTRYSLGDVFGTDDWK